MCKKHRVTGRENFGPGRAGRGHEGSHLYSTPWSHHVMEQRSQVSTVLVRVRGSDYVYLANILSEAFRAPRPYCGIGTYTYWRTATSAPMYVNWCGTVLYYSYKLC